LIGKIAACIERGEACECDKALKSELADAERSIRTRIAERLDADALNEDSKSDGYGFFVEYLRSLARQIRNGSV
jgi:hypothetical protein